MPSPMMPELSGMQARNVSQSVNDNLSVMNPQDAFLMAERGMLRKDMSVRELFSTLGVDVEGPVTQLADMVSRETQKANPLQKMKAVATSGQMSDPVSARMPGAGGSLDDLVNGGM